MLIFSKWVEAVDTRQNGKSRNYPPSELLLANPSQSHAVNGKVRSVVFPQQRELSSSASENRRSLRLLINHTAVIPN